MSTLCMLMMIGAVELWRVRQVLLFGAGLSLLLTYLWRRWQGWWR
jgi:hypothetical protein